MKKNSFTKLFLTTLLLGVLLLAGCSDSIGKENDKNETKMLKAATNAQPTSAYIYTAALSEILKNDKDNPIVMEVMPYAGGIGNAELVEKGEADVGIMFNNSSNWAYNGKVAYDKEHKNIRGLVGGMNEYFIGVIARSEFLEKNNINTLTEIKEKEIPVRIITNPQGTMAEFNTRITLEAHGLDYEMIKKFGGSVEFTSDDVIKTGFQNRTADLYIMALGKGHKVVAEIATTTDITLMEIEEEYDDFFMDNGYAKEGKFPAGEFKNQENEIFNPSFYVTYIINKDIDDDIAYQLAKAVNEHKDEMTQAHAAMGDFEPDKAGHAIRNGDIPLHPGAERYYKEIGALD